MRPFTETERQQFLADPKRIAVLSVAATDGRAPASAPLGYDYTPGGNIRIMTGKGTRKARLMDRAGVVTLVVQREEPPYQYVAVEGTVVETVCPAPADMLEASAIKYLGEERGRAHLKIMEGSEEEWGANLVMYTIRPDRWISADFTGDV